MSVNPSRVYISGQSNISYNEYFDSTYMALRDVPLYFVCGDGERDLILAYTEMIQKLRDAGNQNIEFVTFHGGHEYHEEDVMNMYLWMRNFQN